MAQIGTDKLAEIHALVDEQRDRALWYLRRDYYPQTHSEILRALDAIAARADLATFQRVGALRQWLLQNFSDTSAG